MRPHLPTDAHTPSHTHSSICTLSHVHTNTLPCTHPALQTPTISCVSQSSPMHVPSLPSYRTHFHFSMPHFGDTPKGMRVLSKGTPLGNNHVVSGMLRVLTHLPPPPVQSSATPSLVASLSWSQDENIRPCRWEGQLLSEQVRKQAAGKGLGGFRQDLSLLLSRVTQAAFPTSWGHILLEPSWLQGV